MPLYKGDDYLSEALDSILNQTYSDFEFIIICDDPSDEARNILDKYQRNDFRVKVYYQARQGLVNSLNKGISLACGEYIARMDADDISMPERLKTQIQYLEEHPCIGLVGTWYESIDENNRKLNTHRLPARSDLMTWYFLFGSVIAHPTAIMRKKCIEKIGYYNPDALHAEDYDLWVRLNKITQIANIPEVLLKYRVWRNSVGSTHSDIQDQNTIKIMQSQISSLLGFEVSFEEVSYIRTIIKGLPLTDINQVESTSKLLHQIYTMYLNKNKLCEEDKRDIKVDISNRLCFLALNASKMSVYNSAAIFVKAAKLNNSLIRPTIAFKGLRRLTK